MIFSNARIPHKPTSNNHAMALCADCRRKYYRMHCGGLNDQRTLEKYGCEVCDGDTDPALWGYGTSEQQEEARSFARGRAD